MTRNVGEEPADTHAHQDEDLADPGDTAGAEPPKGTEGDAKKKDRSG